MDETPIKAGRSGHGKMKTGYFWPIYGERDEVCFPFFPSRGSEHVRTTLGLMPGANRVLLTDGYSAYAKYAKKLEITHAHVGFIAVERSLRPCRPIRRRWRKPSSRSLSSTGSRIRSGSRTSPVSANDSID
jgi:IS1 family transposase